MTTNTQRRMAPSDEQTGDQKRDMAAREEMRADIEGRKSLEIIARDQIPLPDIQELRKRMGLSQVRFAERFGFSVAALRNWEQSRRVPDRSTRLLLRLIAEEPELVERVAGGA